MCEGQYWLIYFAAPERFHVHAGSERVGEVVYIPVYDRSLPTKGVRAVLEVMMQQGAAEPMAEVITYISTALNLLQVCLAPSRPPLTEVAAMLHCMGSALLPVLLRLKVECILAGCCT